MRDEGGPLEVQASNRCKLRSTSSRGERCRKAETDFSRC